MATARILDQITQEMANEMITSRHVRTTALGCWEANTMSDAKGYVRVTTYAGGEHQAIRIHQIALVAYNRRDELKATLGRSNYDISHLCHNGRCFNPNHLIVESCTNNGRRKICKGQKILVHDGFSYHPCPHGRVEKLRKCVLPLHHLDNTPNCDEQAVATSYPDPDDIVTLTNDATADKYDSITPTMAQELIDRYRGDTTELGCWNSTLKAYMRNSPRVTLRKLHVRPNLDQVALIATNRLDELKRALGRRNNCSVTHLCHNFVCINPEHIIVESKSNSHRRKTCIGKTAIVREGVTDNPCPHGRVEKMRTCILPEEHAVATSEERESTEPTPADEATEDTGATAGKFDQITPIMAQELINKYHAITTDLGCWESDLKPNSSFDRVRLNIKDLQAFGVRPFLHQLAVIATNRGDELKMTLDRSSRSRFDVSHLCHNGKCINPEHLIVESSRNNLSRRSCNGHKAITYGNFSYHPCPHDGVEKMRKCILPTLRLEAGHYGNDSETSQGQTGHGLVVAERLNATMELLCDEDRALIPSETEDGPDVAVTDDNDDNGDKNVSDEPSLPPSPPKNDRVKVAIETGQIYHETAKEQPQNCIATIVQFRDQ